MLTYLKFLNSNPVEDTLHYQASKSDFRKSTDPSARNSRAFCTSLHITFSSRPETTKSYTTRKPRVGGVYAPKQGPLKTRAH